MISLNELTMLTTPMKNREVRGNSVRDLPSSWINIFLDQFLSFFGRRYFVLCKKLRRRLLVGNADFIKEVLWFNRLNNDIREGTRKPMSSPLLDGLVRNIVREAKNFSSMVELKSRNFIEIPNATNNQRSGKIGHDRPAISGHQ